MDFQPMSPEEMQRTMQFLLNQQAKFAADFEIKFDRLTDKTERIAAGVKWLEELLDRDHGYPKA